MCPTHPICPDKLLCLGLMTVIKYLFQPFLPTYTFSLEDTVQRLCTVCLRTVTSLRYKLVWVFFFRSENSVILYLIVALTPCACKSVVTQSSSGCSVTEPTQLSLRGSRGLLQRVQRAPGCGRQRCDAVTRLCSTFEMLLDFTRERQTPLYGRTSCSALQLRVC